MPAGPPQLPVLAQMRTFKLGQTADAARLTQLPPMPHPFRTKVVSLARAPERACYLVSNRQRSGSVGKLRLALPLWPGDEPLAVKEMRQASTLPYPSTPPPIVSLTATPSWPRTRPTGRQMALQELRLIRLLHGEHMALSLLQTHKSFWLLMPLLHGDVHRDLGPVDPRPLDLEHFDRADHGPRLAVFTSAMQQLSHQLAHLHRLGVMHRDIKGDNLLLGAPDQFYLMDFGAHCLADANGRWPAETHGTPTFTAPEAYRPGQGSQQVDVYALGLALLPLLLPEPPVVSPFGYLTQADGSPQAITQAQDDRRNLADYEAFHASLAPPGCSHVDLKYLRPRNKFGAYFRLLQSISPRLCRELLQHVLQPEPTRRFDAQQLWTWSEALPLAPGCAAQALSARIAADSPRAALVAAMREERAHRIASGLFVREGTPLE